MEPIQKHSEEKKLKCFFCESKAKVKRNKERRMSQTKNQTKNQMKMRVVYAMKDVRVSAKLKREAEKWMDMAIDAVKSAECRLDAACAGVGGSVGAATQAVNEAEHRAREAEKNWEEVQEYWRERREHARIVVDEAIEGDVDMEDMELEDLEDLDMEEEDLNMEEEE